MNQQEQEQKAYRRLLDQQQQHPAESSSQDSPSSMSNSEVDSLVSSLREYGPPTVHTVVFRRQFLRPLF